MNRNKTPGPLTLLFGTYLLCYGLRIVEYMLIRTDQTMIGEAFIHKAAGIVVLAVVLGRLRWRWRDIGFVRNAAVRGTLCGLLLGAVSFAIAYGVEMIVQQTSGNVPRLSVYLSSYSITGNAVMQTNALFFAICIAGNILNVVMEEGVFRGLYMKLFEEKGSCAGAMLCSSLLFGLWHIAAPLRALLDGNMQIGSFVMAALMQVLLTGITGVMLCLLVKITGSLWTAMAVHFVNNTIVNVLHVLTATGADERQVIRISIAQTVTFLVVLAVFVAKKSHRLETFRQCA